MNPYPGGRAPNRREIQKLVLQLTYMAEFGLLAGTLTRHLAQQPAIYHLAYLSTVAELLDLYLITLILPLFIFVKLEWPSALQNS